MESFSRVMAQGLKRKKKNEEMMHQLNGTGVADYGKQKAVGKIRKREKQKFQRPVVACKGLARNSDY